MWTLGEYSMWEVPPRQWTGPWQPGWHTGIPKGRTTQHHPAPAELRPFAPCQPARSMSANIPWDSCAAAISLCTRGKRCSLLGKLPVLKAARDRNASAAALMPVRVNCFAPPSSQHPWEAEAAVTKPASFECVRGYCKEQVGASQADHGKCNTENNSLILMLQFFWKINYAKMTPSGCLGWAVV